MGANVSNVCSSDCCSRDPTDQYILQAKDVNLDDRLQEMPGLQVKMPSVAQATARRDGSPPPSREWTESVLAPISREPTGSERGCSPPISREPTGSERGCSLPISGEVSGTKPGCNPVISRELTVKRVVCETPSIPASSATSGSLPPGDKSEDENFEEATPQLPPGDDYSTSDEEEQKKEEKQAVEEKEEEREHKKEEKQEVDEEEEKEQKKEKQEVDEEEEREERRFQEESAKREEVEEEQEDYDAMPTFQALGAFDPDIGPMIVPEPPPTAEEIAAAQARKRAREEAAARLTAARWETPEGLEQRRLEAEEDLKADSVPTRVPEISMNTHHPRRQRFAQEPEKERGPAVPPSTEVQPSIAAEQPKAAAATAAAETSATTQAASPVEGKEAEPEVTKPRSPRQRTSSRRRPLRPTSGNATTPSATEDGEKPSAKEDSSPNVRNARRAASQGAAKSRTLPPSQGSSTSAAKDDKSLVLSFRLPGGAIKRVDFGPRKPPIGVEFTKAPPVKVAQVQAGGHAAEFGIKEGWLIHAIMDEVVPEGEPFSEVFRRLAAANTAVRGQPTPSQQEAANAADRGQPTPSQQEANPHSTSQKSSKASKARQSSASQASSKKDRATSSGPKATAGTRTGLILTLRLPDNSKREVDFGQRKPPMGMDLSKDTPVTVVQVRPGSHAEELGIKLDWQISKVNGTSARGKSHEEVLIMMKAACSS